tara:strand:+ start:961 stop:1434 length:474 start_codon:yes stop_codon:yes gene_type:complete
MSNVYVKVYSLLIQNDKDNIIKNLLQKIDKNSDGLYHSCIIYNNNEYSYGHNNTPKIHIGTGYNFNEIYGEPIDTIYMGYTDTPYFIFDEYIESLKSKYNYNTYDVYSNNCNCFINDVTNFLLNKDIPRYINQTSKRLSELDHDKSIKIFIEKLINY